MNKQEQTDYDIALKDLRIEENIEFVQTNNKFSILTRILIMLNLRCPYDGKEHHIVAVRTMSDSWDECIKCGRTSNR